MINGAEENIAKSIEENWDNAILEIRVSTNFAACSGTYFTNGVKKLIKVSKFDPFIDDSLHELYAITTQNGTTNKWNRATYHVSKGGDHTIELICDQELYDEVYAKKNS